MVSESTVPSYRFHYDKCMPAITALTQHKIVVIKGRASVQQQSLASRPQALVGPRRGREALRIIHA